MTAFSKVPVAAALVETDNWGTVPADQVVVVLAAQSEGSDADAVAKALGGKIVGAVPDIALYQIETDGTTADDLDASLEAAAAAEGVDLAFPNVALVLSAPEVTSCAPLADQVYEGVLGRSFELIGAQRAWDVLRAAGIDFADVHVGVVDTQLTTAPGELSGATRVVGLEAGDITDERPAGGFLPHGTQVTHLIAADAGNGGIAGPVAAGELERVVAVRTRRRRLTRRPAGRARRRCRTTTRGRADPDSV